MTALNDTSRLPMRILVLLSGLAALGALATNIILPAFPAMGADLGVTERELAITLSSFFIVFALGQLFVGPLSDRWGRRPVILSGLVIFMAGSVICATAGTLETLVAGRIVQALGACAASVLARAVARDLFEGPALTRTLALVMIAMSSAPGFSPLLGGGLEAMIGWRGTFLIVGFSGAALAAHYLLSARESLPAHRRARHSPAAVAADYFRLARDPRFIRPAAAVGLIIGGLYTFFATAPAVLIAGLGLTSLEFGLFFAATVFVVFGAGFMAQPLAARLGRYRAASLGAVLAVAGGSSLFLHAAAPSFLVLTGAIIVFLFGMGLVNPLGTAIALEPFGKEAGLASALLGFLQMAFAALGAFLVSAVAIAPELALAIVMSSSAALALVIFLPAGQVRSPVHEA